ncbi:unnamed protein product [Durusdinium trenchii]|uniref:Glycerophosphocholine acyltransferase 1 n=1 Tax=Durusdinium trenchii TaxID=1381693 RepID=A0ABP0M771_9DINO
MRRGSCGTAAALFLTSLTLQGCEGGRWVMKGSFVALLIGMLPCVLLARKLSRAELQWLSVVGENEDDEKAPPQRARARRRSAPRRSRCFWTTLVVGLSWLPWLLVMLFTAWLPVWLNLCSCRMAAVCDVDWLGFPNGCRCPSRGTTPDDIEYLYKGSDYCWHCPENMLSVASAEESADCVCDAQSIPCHLDPMSFNALDRERLWSGWFRELFLLGLRQWRVCPLPERLQRLFIPPSTAALRLRGRPGRQHYRSDDAAEPVAVGLRDVQWKLGRCFVAILYTLCPLLVACWLRFRWPMMLDILVSSLDFGSDLFWLLTGRFYQEATLRLGFCFVLGSSLVFILAFYFRGCPPLLLRILEESEAPVSVGDVAEGMVPWLLLPLILPWKTLKIIARGTLRCLRRQDVKGCVCRSRALRILEKARQRLLRRGTYQVFETIEGELQYLVANLCVTMCLILSLAFGWLLVALGLLAAFVIAVASASAMILMLPVLMVLAGLFGVIVMLMYLFWCALLSLVVIVGLILLGMLLHLTRLLAAEVVSSWYGALWARQDPQRHKLPQSPSSSPSLRAVAAEPPSPSPPPTSASALRFLPQEPDGEPPPLAPASPRTARREREWAELELRSFAWNETLWNWLVFGELVCETLPMLVLNVWNWTLLEGAGVPDVSLANVGALVSSCMMLARLGYWQFYHVWFNDYGIWEVPTRLRPRPKSRKAQSRGSLRVSGRLHGTADCTPKEPPSAPADLVEPAEVIGRVEKSCAQREEGPNKIRATPAPPVTTFEDVDEDVDDREDVRSVREWLGQSESELLT